MKNDTIFTHASRSCYKFVAGVIFFCLLVFLLDILLGFVGLEKYDKEFYPKSSYPIFIPAKGNLSQNYERNPHFKYALNYQTFLKKKAKGAIRIFVLGGSAAYAWPYREEYGFTGCLRRALNRVQPGKFEVINAAGMSYGSHRVLNVLQDVILFDPDLVIVYSGNNEYIEKNVIAGLKSSNGILNSISAILGRTQLYRAIRLVLFRLAPSIFQQKMKNDLTDLRAEGFVNRGARDRSVQYDQEVLNNFKNNISAMKNLISTTGAKGIFCTVPSNIADWHPEMTIPQVNNDKELASWENLQNEVSISLDLLKQDGLDTVQKNTILLRLKNFLTEMLIIAPDHAGSIYLLGQVLMRLGENEIAYSNLIRAKDLDARPIRALSSFNEAIRTLTTKKISEDNFLLIDLEKIFGEDLRKGTQQPIFLDYCHLTEDAHKSVAIHILPAIEKLTGLDLPLEKVTEWIKLDDWGTQNIDASVQANVYYAKGITYLHNGSYKEAEESFQEVLKLESESSGPFISGVYANLGSIYQLQGDHNRYKKMLFKALEAYPNDQVILIAVGFLFLEEENNLERSEQMFQKAIHLNPYSPGALEGLARIAMQKGAVKEAISHYQEALSIAEDNPKLWKNLGKAYLAIGEKKKAIHALQTSLTLDFSDQETTALLNNTLQP